MTTKLEEQLISRCAYHERDSRESWNTVKVLVAAGFFTDEQYGEASRLVCDSRESNPYTDIAQIKTRIVADLKKEKS